MMLTYRQIKAAVDELTEEQLDMNATVVYIHEDKEFALNGIEETILASEIPDRYALGDDNTELWEDCTEWNLPCFVVSV